MPEQVDPYSGEPLSVVTPQERDGPLRLPLRPVQRERPGGIARREHEYERQRPDREQSPRESHRHDYTATRISGPLYSTVTVFARFRGWSMLRPRSRAIR